MLRKFLTPDHKVIPSGQTVMLGKGSLCFSFATNPMAKLLTYTKDSVLKIISFFVCCHVGGKVYLWLSSVFLFLRFQKRPAVVHHSSVVDVVVEGDISMELGSSPILQSVIQFVELPLLDTFSTRSPIEYLATSLSKIP